MLSTSFVGVVSRTEVQAARNLHPIHVLLEAQNKMKEGCNRVVEMLCLVSSFAVPMSSV
jgi:hypothetical protein